MANFKLPQVLIATAAGVVGVLTLAVGVLTLGSSIDSPAGKKINDVKNNVESKLGFDFPKINTKTSSSGVDNLSKEDGEEIFLLGTVIIDEEAVEDKERYSAFFSSEEILKTQKTANCMVILKRKMKYNAEYDVEVSDVFARRKEYGDYTEINKEDEAPMRFDLSSKRIVSNPERKNASWVLAKNTFALLTGNIDEVDDVKGDAQLCSPDFYLEFAEIDAVKGLSGSRNYQATTPQGVKVKGSFTFNYKYISKVEYEKLTKADMYDPDIVFQDFKDLKKGMDEMDNAMSNINLDLLPLFETLTDIASPDEAKLSDSLLEDAIEASKTSDAMDMLEDFGEGLSQLYNCSDSIDDMAGNFDNSVDLGSVEIGSVDLGSAETGTEASGMGLDDAKSSSSTNLMDLAYRLTEAVDNFISSAESLKAETELSISNLSEMSEDDVSRNRAAITKEVEKLQEYTSKIGKVKNGTASLVNKTKEKLAGIDKMDESKQKAVLVELINAWIDELSKMTD